MTTRTPSSLKWLIDKRSRLDGKIQRAKKIIDEAHKLVMELPSLYTDLAVIDHALGLHAIRVEPDNIPTISDHRPRIDLPYGDLTRTLLSKLRSSSGKSFTTDEMTVVLLEQFPHLQERAKNLAELEAIRTSVRKRLKVLAATKTIKRLPAQPGSRMGRWVILLICVEN